MADETPTQQQTEQPNEFAVAARRMSVSKDQVNVWLLMENVAEKLKILNYEEEFCAPKGLTPFSRVHFAQPSSNSSTQFSQFLSIVTWLMKTIGADFSVDKYDDPNTCANKLLLSLKSLRFELEFPASKVKMGHGEAVCGVLNFLCDQAMELKKFKWATPEYEHVDAVEEAEVDTEADLGAEIEDEAIESEEEDALYYEQKLDEGKTDVDMNVNKDIIENETSPEMQAIWRTELERVTPKLKVNLSTVGNEWRVHLQQTRIHEQTIRKELPNTGKQLNQMGEEITKVLDKISSKERSLNGQFEAITSEFSTIQQRLKEINTQFDSSGEEVNKLANELVTITDQLAEIKEVMDSRGNSMTDTTPLQKIRKALSKIKAEIKQMDLRIGVVGHTLTQAKMNNKSMDAGNPVDDNLSDGDQFEIENDY